MNRQNTIEEEVNQIRLQIYEKTKEMTPSQLTEYYMQSTKAIIEEYGFRVVASAKEK